VVSYDFHHRTEKKKFQYIAVQGSIERNTVALAIVSLSYISFGTFVRQPIVLEMMIISFDNLLPCHLYINRLLLILDLYQKDVTLEAFFQEEDTKMKSMFAFIALIVFAQGCLSQPMVREVISSPNAPAAIGPYSQAVRVGNRLYLSGQLGMDPATGKLTEGGFAAQARQALENQKAILATAGFSFEDVVQCQVFVTDMNNYSAFNDIYGEYFLKDFPARAVLEVTRIPADGLLEIMMVAVQCK